MIDFTAAQTKAIGLDALDQDTCVVAGPGSGKTAVLIERFRGMVAAGISPLRILAITFTEKATNEMRARLMTAFADQPELVLQIQRAYVSTVHGFCTRLLRENAILAGIDPRFRVLNDLEASALAKKCAAESLDAFLAEDAEAVRSLLASLQEPDLSAAILDVYEVMRAAGTSLREVRERRPPESARAALENVIARCSAIRLPDADLLAARLRERREKPVEREDFQILADFHPNLNKVKQDKDAVKRLRDELIPANHLFVVDEYFAAPRETFVDAIGRFEALYRSRKAEQSALDFSDLEEFSVRLLEENPEARERVRRQFDYILMDEFQDTNGLQSKLLDLLRPEDRFFAVGDINQSIYGFRHADPEVFRTYRARVAEEGKRVAELRENFRSRADILKAVSSLAVPQKGVEPHNLIPARKFSVKKTAPSVDVICCLAEELDRAAKLEAEWVASRIQELRGSLTLESGKAQFGDIAVLARKADPLTAFTAAFDAAGIPYAVTAGKGFFETREVVDLGSLLRVLANPRDEISLAAVLRSPLVGASDAALFELKQRGNLGEALAGSPDPAVRAFAAELVSWREARHSVSPERLLIRAMDRTGYELPLEPRQRTNIEKFLALVRDRSARQSLDDLIDDLERLRDSDPREQDSGAEDTGDVVRLMTIHSAKGLEFRIVFLAAVQSGTDPKSPTALLSPRHGLGLRWRNPAGGESVKDSLYSEIREEQKARETAEANRLLYVAMTRAEEHLVISCSATKKPGHWARYLATHWGLALDTPVAAPEIQSVNGPDGSTFPIRFLCTDQPPAPAQQLSLALATETPALLERPKISGQYDSSASATSVALFADCPRRYYLSRYLGWDGQRARPFMEEDGELERDPVDSSEFGRQVHALLAGAREGMSSEALALAARFESSELGRRLASATRIEREFDFLLAVEDVALVGQIDLWFEESGALVLVDYKTDDVSASEVPLRARAYALQLQLYALALERLTGRAPDQALLYFLRPDVSFPVGVGDEERRRAAAAVREFQQSQNDQRFPLREGAHCHRCPFFKCMCPAVGPFPLN